jgi:hypothetical protein
MKVKCCGDCPLLNRIDIFDIFCDHPEKKRRRIKPRWVELPKECPLRKKPLTIKADV